MNGHADVCYGAKDLSFWLKPSSKSIHVFCVFDQQKFWQVLRILAGMPKPPLLADALSTKFSLMGPYIYRGGGRF